MNVRRYNTDTEDRLYLELNLVYNNFIVFFCFI